MNPSNIHQRRGSAVFEFFHQLGWVPDQLFLIGVGVKADEAIRARALWPDVQITGFEPNPFSYASLKNQFPGVLLPLAVIRENGTRTLHFRHSWKNGSSLTKGESSNQSVEVKCICLENALMPPAKNAFLWLDCEGSELDVLHGAGEFLSGVQAINVEMTGRPREVGWPKPIEIHDFLVDRGFLQSYCHTIRTVVAQHDSVYVRPEIFKPEMSTNLDSVHRWEEWKRANA